MKGRIRLWKSQARSISRDSYEVLHHELSRLLADNVHLADLDVLKHRSNLSCLKSRGELEAMG